VLLLTSGQVIIKILLLPKLLLLIATTTTTSSTTTTSAYCFILSYIYFSLAAGVSVSPLLSQYGAAKSYITMFSKGMYYLSSAVLYVT
jgi:hypothetical protein